VTVSRDLVRALMRISAQPIPHETLTAAKLHLLDAVGVGLAASRTEIGAPYRKAARALCGTGDASVFGLVQSGTAAGAALINGGLIHSLEFDDTHTASIVHGSSLVASVALGVAQEVGADGRAALGAFVRGWEAFIRIGLAAPGAFQAQGFQVTAVAGAPIAALIAGELMGLTEDRRVNAVGISLSQASGVFEFLTNGSSVKSLHPGWAAHAGIVAAILARAGMTGPETAIEGRFGLFRRFAGDSSATDRLRDLIGELGSTWRVREAAFKLRPCCHYLHPFIEAALDLRVQGATIAQAARIECRVPAGAAPLICEPWNEKQCASGHPARWSLPIVVAAALAEGNVSLDTFEAAPSRDVMALAQRIAWQPLERARFPERFEAEITLTAHDGKIFQARVDDVYGNASRPAREDDVVAKFRANARLALTADGAARLEKTILAIENEPTLGAMAAALRMLAPQ
jgi:2-methylcitrate dehydratase PrpD